ncbi:hypothetical protein NEISICOT_01921 [Neisseria sicca ATCC 29256]|uniref:Uncharacterized protein n=1 Tax=Neisseria sicca ATCC 29256 TaxID=547045 RepID=C6M5X2_NEISI|nr:hypothetical protein NEISICOT_01921 [Neisseria sicca ATCC 29256]
MSRGFKGFLHRLNGVQYIRSSENRFRRPLDQVQNHSACFICESPYCSAASLCLPGYGSRFGVADDRRTDTP